MSDPPQPQPAEPPKAMTNEELTQNLMALKDGQDQLAKALGDILGLIRQSQSSPPSAPPSGPPPGASRGDNVDPAIAAQVLGMLRELSQPHNNDPLTELARQTMMADLQARSGRRGLENVILDSVYTEIAKKIGGQTSSIVGAVFE
jgi:hypothetical protein